MSAGADPSTDLRLVVVADDGGVDVPRNAGIVAAVRDGPVGVVSVLACGGALADLVRRLGELSASERPDVGLHFSLTHGTACAGPLPGLTDALGRFVLDKHALWERAFEGRIDPDAVRREALAQFGVLEAAGLRCVRVDGHQHVHLLPGVREGLAAALALHPAVRWVRLGRPSCADGPERAAFPRLPAERVAPAWRASLAAGRVAQAALGTLHDACDALRGGRLRSADVFAGADLVAACTEEAFLAEVHAAVRALRELPQARGIIELMCHPGEPARGSVPFSASPHRAGERAALCGTALRDALDALGVRVVRLRDVGEDAPR